MRYRSRCSLLERGSLFPGALYRPSDYLRGLLRYDVFVFEASDDRFVCPLSFPPHAGSQTAPPSVLGAVDPAWARIGCGGWSGIKPIEQLVPVSFTHCCASTPGLSTWWSTTALKRDLVSRGASRLDAFSGYPVRTWLPGGAAGATTGTPEVRPPRSSRTRGSSSQVSYTHGR